MLTSAASALVHDEVNSPDMDTAGSSLRSDLPLGPQSKTCCVC